VYELAHASKNAGHEVTVVVGKEGALADTLRKEGIPIITVDSMERDISIFSDIISFSTLLKVFHSLRPDIVHLNSAKAGGLGALAARLCGIPVILFTAHGWAFNERRPAWQKGLIRILSFVTVFLSHATIQVSEAVRTDMAWMPFVQRKGVLIPLGIKPPVFLPRAHARETLVPGKTDGVWIGSVAELHPTKRLRDAIEAMGRIKQTHTNTKLVILGEGEERENLEKQIAQLNLDDRVFLCGHISDASRYLSAFDIFTLPSHTEALSYATIEAGYAGLPVVVTAVGGLPEIVGDKGILVPPGDPTSLAHAFVYFIENEERRRTYGEGLRKRVEKLFTLDSMIERTLTVYRQRS